MKSMCFLGSLIMVSFLAVSPGRADEFSIFENTAPAQGTTGSSPPPKATESPESRVARLKAEVRKDTKNFQKIVELAEALRANKEPDKATKLLWKYVDKIPDIGLYLLADIHYDQADYEKSIKAASLLTAKSDKDFRAWTYLGKSRLALKNEKGAIEAFNKAIAAKPDYEPAYLPLITHYEKKKNNYEVRILIQDMIKNIGPRANYLSRICQLNIDDKTFEQAQSFCREAIARDKNIAENHTNLGLSLLYSSDPEKGLALLKAAANKFPKSSYAQVQYGHALQAKKDHIGALNYYKRGAAAQENLAEAWLGIALSAFEVLKYEEALGAYKKACRLDRNTGPQFRKAMITLRNAKNKEWTGPFEAASDQCIFGN